MIAGLVAQIAQGQTRAIARAITLVDEGGDEAEALLAALASASDFLQAPVRVIGLTGSPGAGKSSLSDLLIARYRALGQRVAVIAVDPSSPFSGGAVLGDRVRMGRHALDTGVFIRSMGARGSLGGLAKPARGAIRILAAAGFDIIVLETVGVGQSELDVMHAADTVTVVLTPAGGDQVQATKAGIMEIADLFVINKADLPGADKLAHAIEGMLDVRTPGQLGVDDLWRPPVIQVSAVREQGLGELLSAMEAHHRHLREDGRLKARRLRQRLQELRERLKEALWEAVDQSLQSDDQMRSTVAHVLEGTCTIEHAVEEFLARGHRRAL
ncbi:MAG: methylmalonyl Co-A mutase-associated GTPase MeaB [Firmicutes bacterium]|nr:methylmalonyl Co-A mutase-associated GTPase MeaB [Bacillota bacterium]